MSRFDDRDRVAEKDGPLQDLDHDAPGVDVAGPAAVAQSAELLTAAPDAAGVQAAPVPAAPEPARHAPVEAPRPAVQLSYAGGGSGTQARSGGAAQIIDAGPDAAVDASAQLRSAQARRFDAILDEPAARTPVALRGDRKKKKPTPDTAPETTTEGDSA